ncbi:MAG: hypothetical protein ACKVWR_03120 [Acidimicrobiales bacterium]
MNLSLTTATTDHAADEALFAELDAAERWATGQLALTQSRCVDLCLDLYNLTSRPEVRLVIAEFLADIRKLGAVAGPDMARAIGHIRAAVDVEAAFDRFVLTDTEAARTFSPVS